MKIGLYFFPQKWRKIYFALLYGINNEGVRFENFDLSKRYENEVFIYRPYYNGRCDCGYTNRQELIYKTEHIENCLTKYLEDFFNLFSHYRMDEKTIMKLIEKELRRMNLNYNLKGEFHYLCTCDWRDTIRSWEKNNDHLESCSIVQPNFYFKKSGFQIFSGNKKNEGILMNQKISFKKFRKIIIECYRSIISQRG